MKLKKIEFGIEFVLNWVVTHFIQLLIYRDQAYVSPFFNLSLFE